MPIHDFYQLVKEEPPAPLILSFGSFIALETCQVFLHPIPSILDLLSKIAPELLGGSVSMIVLIGAAPMAISFAFLSMIRSRRVVWVSLGLLTSLALITEPMSNHFYSIATGGKGLDLGTVLFNVLAILIAAVVLAFLLTFLPRLILDLLRKKN